MFCPKCSQDCGDADKFCWSCGNSLAGVELHSGTAAPGGPEQNKGVEPVTGHPRNGRVRAPQGFILGSLGVGFGLAILFTAAAAYMVLFKEIAITSLAVIVPAAAALILFVCAAGIKLLMVHRMWRTLGEHQTLMSPALAAGLLAIPVFNLFWLFPVFRGFSTNYNNYAGRNSRPKPLSGTLFLAYPMLNLATWVPYGAFLAGAYFFSFPPVDLNEWWVPAAGLLIGTVNYVLLLFVAASVCRAVNELAVLSEGVADSCETVFSHELPGGVSYEHREQAGQLQQPAKPVLKCIEGLYAGKMLELEGKLVIGRDPWAAQLVYPHDSAEISRKHCSIYYDTANGYFVLEDHSSNGTFVSSNEALVPGRPYYLNPGDRFFLAGRREMFEVTLEE